MPFEFDATGGLEDWDGFDESGGFVFNEPLREEAEDQPARESGEGSQEQEPLPEPPVPDTFLQTRATDPVWTPPGPADAYVGVPAARGPAGARPPDMAMVPWVPHAGTLPEPAGITMIRAGEELRRGTLDWLLLACRQDEADGTRPTLIPALAPAPTPPTGPELLQAALERAGLRGIEPPSQQPVRHPLAIAPSRPAAELCWAELQERRQECHELRRHSHELAGQLDLQEMNILALEQECWRLRHALDLLQTPVPHPHSSSGSLGSGEHPYRLCGDCLRRPAQVMLRPCSHVALCEGCYMQRQTCPCCGVRVTSPI
jgi:hypothetical protein